MALQLTYTRGANQHIRSMLASRFTQSLLTSICYTFQSPYWYPRPSSLLLDPKLSRSPATLCSQLLLGSQCCFYSPCPALPASPHRDSPDHVQSAGHAMFSLLLSLSLCSGFFQTPLDIFHLSFTIKTIPVTIKKE